MPHHKNTYSDLVGPTACSADTETQVGGANISILPGNYYRIRQIRLCYYQGVIDKATTGKLELKIDKVNGPFKFAVGGSIGITTTSGATGPNTPTEVIECDILVPGKADVGVYCTFAEALEEVTASILYVEA